MLEVTCTVLGCDVRLSQGSTGGRRVTRVPRKSPFRLVVSPLFGPGGGSRVHERGSSPVDGTPT